MLRITLLILSFLLINSCKKNDDDNPPTPLEQLPEATQRGAQTFGCLINGEAFIPPRLGSNSPRAFYQFTNGGYTLGISAQEDIGDDLVSILIGSINTKIIENSKYNLYERVSGNYYGTHAVANSGNLMVNSTSINDPGLLTITNFDPENFIISGTFQFTIVDGDGKIYEITDGRFDMNYTN